MKKVLLEVDGRCNQKCPHCYLKQNKGRLSIDEALQKVKQLKDLGVREIIPIWGEVLDHPENLMVVRACGQDGIPTTGAPLLRRPGLAQEIRKAGIEEVRLSANYFSEQLGLSPVGTDSLPTITHLLLREGIRPAAHVVIWVGNHHLVREICEQAIKDGLQCIRLLNLMPVTRQLARHTLDQSQIRHVFEQVVQCREIFPREILDIRLRGNFGPRQGTVGEKLAKDGVYCPAGKNAVFIRTDGSVYPCLFLTEEKWKLGTFSNGRITIDRQPLVGFRRHTCFLLEEKS